jgi:hypothetical protein
VTTPRGELEEKRLELKHQAPAFEANDGAGPEVASLGVEH